MQSHNPLSYVVTPYNQAAHLCASGQACIINRNFSIRQCKILSCQLRNILVVAGRRSGKTTVAVNWLLFNAAETPQQTCYFIGPTLKQAQETAWKMLVDATEGALLRRVRHSDLEIELINGSIIRLHGPESLRGAGLDAVVLDEYAYMAPKLWPEVVRPMLADREGRALICTTPNGFNHLYDLYVDVKNRPDWATFHFPTREGGFVSKRELENLASTMDDKLFAQEIEARFEPQGDRVYHAFSRELNVCDVTPSGALSVLVGLDFNVDPMVAVVGQKVGAECHICDEVVLQNSNTFEMMAELSHRYPQHGLVHPDPSGCARKTSAQAGVTDHGIILNAGWDVYPLKPYPVINRINAVNALLKNANGSARLFIHPKCEHLIRSLEGLTYKEGTRFPDKSSGLDHAADALGYLVGAVFPMIDPNGFSMRSALTGEDLMA